MADRAAVCGEVLLVPMGLEGHVAPFMYLARRILERGISCTLLLEDQGIGPLERNFSKYGSLENTAGFSVKLVPTVKSQGLSGNLHNWSEACEPVFQEVLRHRLESGQGPKCMVVDQFAGWTNRWAKELAIPRYVFALSCATFLYWMYRYSTLLRKDHLLERVREDPVLDLPGAPDIRLSEAEQLVISEHETFASNGDTFDDAAGILFSSFYDLEASVFDNFSSQLDTAGRTHTKGHGKSKAIPIGPLAHPKRIEHSLLGSPEKDSKCIQWLDTRSPGSVVYIAFGSMAALPKAQIIELANALETTKVNFLWILRAPSDGPVRFAQWSDGSEFLPPGFQERTKDYGLVHSSFAPQLRILEHPATGAFLTHCGWNSALESITRGVPLIGWPRINDQLLCLRVLVHAGVAARIRPEMTSEADLLKSVELERAIRTWMMDGPGKTQLRERVLELQHRATEAVSPGGSSYQSFEDFIQNFLPQK